MKKLGMVILLVSGALVATLAGSGMFFRVGAGESSYRQVVVFSEVLSLVLDNYVDPVEADVLMAGAYEGMLRGLDPQAAYLTPAELEDWNKLDGDLSAGPGVTVLKGYGALQIVAVDPGSPAEQAGLTAGDQIRSIGDQPVRDSSLEQSLRMLRGAAGTSVRLEIIHPHTGFSREELDLPRRLRSTVPYRLENRGGVLVLQPRDLTRLDVERLAAELAGYRDRGIARLLVDLRNVAEGTPRDLAAFGGLFHRGEAYRLVNRAGDTVEEIRLKGGDRVWDREISLLVNGATAGAAEGFARLLQVAGQVRVYGEATYGMASEPELFELASGAGVLVASREWRLASGEGWIEDGVTPDVDVTPRGLTYLERMEDQMDRTLEELGAEL